MALATAPTTKTTYPTLSPTETWPPQGEWTYDDFVRLLEDGVRYEIIEGVLFMTNAPGPEHQYAVTQILFALETVSRATKAGLVFTSPIEVHLSPRTRPVQPDALFIAEARHEIVGKKIIQGAPDLIVEVLSTSTMRADRTVKLEAYEQAGVREYWIANPKTRSIEIYALMPTGYELHGEFGPGEEVTSRVLPEMKFITESVFVRA